MRPNYNFENEIAEQYGLAAIDFRTIAKMLLTKYKVIDEKEYQVIMWQACNLPIGSLIRKGLLTELKKLELICRTNETRILQVKLEL